MPAHAMRVSPMVAEMSSKGSGAVARIEVQNLNPTNLPFETRITRIDYDDKGNMTETPADGDFLVFPPQGVLPANARQVVRLQWVGAGDIPASRGYYMSVNQLPVALDPQAPATAGAQVQIVYHMKALITVAPPGALPKVELVSATPTEIDPPPAADGAAAGAKLPGVEVTVRNTGSRHAMMSGAKWTIEGRGIDGKPVTVELDQAALNRDIGVGYLAALNGQRTFRVPTGVAFGSGPITVRFAR
ncbi:molecular chaperone [Sphingomonas sp. LaA6.9]|uniref:molecular chaperone n=1 Tax=Sphingomonas sp. LaA6.9 TaxID=2919914 RepID=UPI001F4F6AB9|nr:molecular chaperone [Sphingomonas sp. LaA6.9]MCJ8158072.1 molecular chaperone [Sphingomonas sp. LaA6.9]